MINDVSQNGEAAIVARYFGDFKGRLLDLGANDGKTFSNSYNLIQNGWEGVLLEPSPAAFKRLSELYRDTSNVECMDFGICDNSIGRLATLASFYESGSHLPDKSDVALLSGLAIQDKWKHLDYKKVDVTLWSFEALLMMLEPENQIFDFITIDAEGEDWNILQQINLSDVGCRCLCVEWNGDQDLCRKFTDYCAGFGLREIHRNAENIIFAI